MRKLVVASTLLAVLALAAIAGYLYMQREQVLQRALEHYGSAILGVSVSVSSVRVSPVDGDGAVRGLRIGTPSGFQRDVATADTIELHVEPASLTKDAVHVRRIAVLSPHIVYEQSTAGTNLETVQQNMQRYLGATSANERRAQTKFIVDHLIIRAARVTYIPLSNASKASAELRLPDISLRDIGKRRGGVTAAELSKIVMDALIARTANAAGQRVLEGTVQRLFKR